LLLLLSLRLTIFKESSCGWSLLLLINLNSFTSLWPWGWTILNWLTILILKIDLLNLLIRYILLTVKLLRCLTIWYILNLSIYSIGLLLISSFSCNIIIESYILRRFYFVNSIIQLLHIWNLQMFSFLIHCKLLKLLINSTLTYHLWRV
jgi:hypothetical protein